MTNSIDYIAKQPLGSLNQLVSAITDNYIQMHCPNSTMDTHLYIANILHTRLPSIFYFLTLGSEKYLIALQQLVATVDALDRIQLCNIYYDEVLPATYLLPCLQDIAKHYSTNHELYKTITNNLTELAKAQMLLES